MEPEQYEKMEIHVKGEDRERIERNSRKMTVTGRSALLIMNLTRQAANRRRTRRLRKGGKP